MTQPNEQLRETIEEALEKRAKFFKPGLDEQWLRALLEENKRLEQKLQNYEGCKGIVDYYSVLSNLRECMSENERLRGLYEREREIAEQAKAERDIYKSDYGSAEIRLAEKEKELSAKDKVLEWYASFWNHDVQLEGVETTSMRLDRGDRARSILSQYPPNGDT